MKFIDSNILAYAFYNNKYQDRCQKIIKEGGIINTINLVEAFNIIEHEISREIAIKSIRGLLKSNLKIIDADLNLIFESLKKGEKSQLNFIDLIHYTSALLNNCETIISYDKDFNGLEIPREEI